MVDPAWGSRARAGWFQARPVDGKAKHEKRTAAPADVSDVPISGDSGGGARRLAFAAQKHRSLPRAGVARRRPGNIRRVYGVPADLGLTPLVGSRIINIEVGLYNTLFIFEIRALVYGGINAEGRWEVHGADDRPAGGRSRGETAVTDVPFEALLGASVQTFTVSAPPYFELLLSSGVRLRFYDDSAEYESITIQPGDYVI